MARESNYVQREVDDALAKRAHEWLISTRGTAWLSLISQPGRGNSSLLEHFRLVTRNHGPYKYTLGDIRIIHIEGSLAAENHEPSALPPLARAVFAAYIAGPRPKLAEVWRRFRWSVLFVFATLAAIAFAVLDYLIRENEHGPIDMEFWQQLIRQLSQAPLKAIEILIVAVIFTLLCEWIAHVIWHGFPQARPKRNSHKRDDSELEYAIAFSEYGDDFVKGLKTLCHHSSRGVILTVDNASLLPENDRRVLEDLLEPPSEDSPIARFARSQRLFIVTLDYEREEWSISTSPQHFDCYEVPAFDELQLRAIYQDCYPERSQEQFELVREAAHANVGLLFDQPPAAKEVIRQFREKRKSDSPDEFGFGHLMACWAARDLTSVDKIECKLSLEGIFSHLADFGLSAPLGIKRLTAFFTKSQMVRVQREKLYFDPVAVRALRNFLNEKHADLMAQTHYLWAATLSGGAFREGENPGLVLPLAGENQLFLKQAAWHASRIGVLLTQASASAILTDMKLTDRERAKRQRRMAELLLEVASIYQREGNTRESDDLLDDSLDWIRGLERSLELRMVARVIAGLWRNFWVSGDAATCKKLEDIASESPAVKGEPEWSINRRYLELMCSKPIPTSLPPLISRKLSDVQHNARNRRDASAFPAELRNVHSLTECLLTMRERQGFVVPGLEDKTIATPEPCESQDFWFECSLWQMRTAAAIHRSDDKVLEAAIAKWRDRMLSPKLSPAQLGAEAQIIYGLARLWHLICQTWRIRSTAIDKMQESERDSARASLEEFCTRISPVHPGPGVPMQEFAFRQAQMGYQRALRLGALLHWHAFLTEVDFHFGVLLLQHTPEEYRIDNPPWWNAWEDLFNACLQNERDLAWMWHTPAIHRLRFHFFEKQDLPTASNDVYRTFQAVRDANYPTALVLEWHSTAQAYLTNYGHAPEDQRRCAELHKLWAHELAGLDEAIPSRTFKNCLDFEKVKALTFASQALRRAKDLVEAAKLLDEADLLLLHSQGDPAALEEGAKEARELKTALRMERAWVIGSAEEGRAESRQMIQAIWRDVEDGDRHNANILGSLLRVESELKRLDDPWPPEGQPAHLDSDNPRLSLPESWFAPPVSVKIANVFEFRFRQLIRTISTRAAPSLRELYIAAAYRWRQEERFGETLLAFAEANARENFLHNWRNLMVEALSAVAFYFENIEPQDETELSALHLLIRYGPEAHEVRVHYIQVLRKHTYLVQRELKSRALQPTDWFELARRMDYLFRVLLDRDRQATQLASEVRSRAPSVEVFMEQTKIRNAALEAARRHLLAGEFALGARELSQYLPPEKIYFVLLDDLECLDLWLRLGAHMDPRPSDFGKHAGNLRDLACRYIGQFSLTVREPEAQHLALELLDSIQLPHNPIVTAAA